MNALNILGVVIGHLYVYQSISEGRGWTAPWTRFTFLGSTRHVPITISINYTKQRRGYSRWKDNKLSYYYTVVFKLPILNVRSRKCFSPEKNQTHPRFSVCVFAHTCVNQSGSTAGCTKRVHGLEKNVSRKNIQKFCLNILFAFAGLFPGT